VTPTRTFSADDLAVASRLVVAAWGAAVDRDWRVPAGPLEWSCWKTPEHTVDCVFSYAFFLASRATAAYPPFDELRALPEATPADLGDGLRAATTMLHAVIVTSDPQARAIIRQRPRPVTGAPIEFAARGALEMVLHGHDVASGLGVHLRLPDDLARRLLGSTDGWPGAVPLGATGDAWSDLIARSGRPRPEPG